MNETPENVQSAALARAYGSTIPTRVMQTKVGNEGNCFDACLASLLGVPIDTVNFFRGENTWYADLQTWLAPRGLAYVEIDLTDPTPFYHFPLPVLTIVGGPSPRGVKGGHSVIVELHGWNKTIVHDPHPSGVGLVMIKTIGLLVYSPNIEGKSWSTFSEKKEPQ